MQPYEIKGEVEYVGEEQVISDKFSKRQLVVTLEGKYPKPIAIEFTGDDMEKVDKINVGTEVEVKFYLNGYQGKKDPTYYGVSLRGVDVAVISSGSAVTPEILKAADDAQSAMATPEPSDDLPF